MTLAPVHFSRRHIEAAIEATHHRKASAREGARNTTLNRAFFCAAYLTGPRVRGAYKQDIESTPRSVEPDGNN
jgi:hypothetical protein